MYYVNQYNYVKCMLCHDLMGTAVGNHAVPGKHMPVRLVAQGDGLGELGHGTAVGR